MTTSRFLRWPLAALLLAMPVRAGLYFTPAPAPEGADTSALAADGATLWAGTLRGVWKLQSGAWSFDGLSDKTVSSLAVFGGTVWAATGDGLWKRGADGTWSVETLPGDSSILNALATDGSALYAAGIGTFRNTGGTWAALAPAGGFVSALTVFQGDLVAGVLGYGAVRYPGGTGLPVAMSLGLGVAEGGQAFATFGGNLYAGTPRGVYAWNGMSWVGDAAYGLHDVRALASASGYLWAASVDGGVSRKSGSTWSDVNGGLLFPSAKSFALLGTDLYVGTAGAPVYRFSGGSWSPAGTGLAAAIVSDAFFFEPAQGTVVATRGAGMAQVSETHPETFAIPSGCGDVRAVAIARTAPIPQGIFLAATNCGPYEVSGSHASLVNDGLPDGAVITSLQTVSVPPTGAFAGTTNAGIWRYTVPSWSPDNEGLPSTASISVIRQVGNDVLAGGGFGVLRRETTGTWKDQSAGLPFGATVFSFGGSSDNAVFAGLAASGVYRRDPGPIWRQDAAGLPAAPVFSLEEVGPRGFAAAGTGGFFRKTGGAWLREAAGLPTGADVRVVRYGGRSSSGVNRILAGTAGSGLFGADTANSVVTIPVVLDVAAPGGGRFRTELTIGSPISTPLDVTLAFTAAAGFGAPALGSATVTIPPLTEIRAADALSYLRGLGMQIPVAAPGAPVAGSLSMSAGNSTDFLYGYARSYTEGTSGGTYGVFLEGTSDLDAAEDEAYVYGLRSVPGVARSNLAVTYVPTPERGTDPITVEVQLWDADGNPAPTLLTRTLAPGEWYQWNGIVSKAGLADGTYAYARIRRVSGIGPFIAYGVVNDALTSDGSILPMFRPGGVAAARKLIVPVVVDTLGEAGSHFTTELTLANDSPIPTPVDLAYHPAPGFGTAGGAPLVSLDLAAGQQTTIPDILQYLRDHGVSIPASTAGPQAGTIGITFRSLQSLDTPRTVALARTFTPNPDTATGGTFGVAYPAFAFGGGARWSAYVPGLVQSAAARSNLAVVHAGGGSGGPVTLSVTFFDSATGFPVGTTLSKTLYPGDWYQWSRVLEKAGVPPGTPAYAVVTRVSGDDTFLAYGVVNDAVTSDGSWVAMIPSEEY